MYTQQWMETNCKVLQVDQNMSHGLAQFGTFTSKLAESTSGRVFLDLISQVIFQTFWGFCAFMWGPTCCRLPLAILDCSVWPSNMTYLASAISTFNACLSMSPNAGGFVYVPAPHQAITQEVLVKHRRKLEDGLMNGGMYVLNRVSLQFVKQGSSSNDKRKSSQEALLVVASENASDGSWTTSHIWEKLLINGIPLIRVSDMLGYDTESKPGASARVEQIHGQV